MYCVQYSSAPYQRDPPAGALTTADLLGLLLLLGVQLVSGTATKHTHNKQQGVDNFNRIFF